MRDLKPLDGPFGGRMKWDMNKGMFFDDKFPNGPFYDPFGKVCFERWREDLMKKLEAERKLLQKYKEEIDEYEL